MIVNKLIDYYRCIYIFDINIFFSFVNLTIERISKSCIFYYMKSCNYYELFIQLLV